MDQNASKGSPDRKRQELIGLIRELSYREGAFTLVSGQKSSFYIDLKSTSLHPRGARLIGELAVDALQSAGLEIDAVGGMTLGADPLATAVSLAALENGIEWPAFIVRKESKGHGTGQFIEGADNLKPGARVLVLEDTMTTGGSALRAVDRLRDAGYQPVGILTVCDRGQGGAEKVRDAGLEFLALATLAEVQSSG